MKENPIVHVRLFKFNTQYDDFSFFYYVNLSIFSKTIYNNIGKGGEALN